jgi:hypothetical protein
VLGGWRVSGVTTVQSGLPLNITVSDDRAGIGRPAANTGANGQRPNVVAKPALPGRERTDRRWFNTNAFLLPADGTFGNAPRNAVRGPGSINTDLSLHKRIPLRSPWTAELRVEAFNVFNHANAFSIGSVLGTASFGQVTQFADPRIIQLALRVSF